MRRDEILKEAEHLISIDRAEVYGDAAENFDVIAKLWSSYLKRSERTNNSLAPQDVAAMMILVKVARIKVAPGHVDNWVDLAGYAALGGEMI